MCTGRVASVPQRKNASTNSSNEMVKVSSRLATIPGRMMGKVTRQKVPQAFSPRSRAASSMLGSNPSIREISTSIENGVQSRRWPMPTVTSERPTPPRLKVMSSEMPRMISGITSGTMMNPISPPRPRMR